jgi:hypothetical protein
MDVTTISNNVPGGASQAMDSGVWCNASVSDGGVLVGNAGFHDSYCGLQLM